MKSKIIYGSVLTTIILLGLLYFFIWEKAENKSTTEKYPSEWYDYQRTYPNKGINQSNYLKAMKQVSELQSKSRSSISWEFAGPTNIGGRISDIEVHPSSPSTVYIGAASGGIFKSTDNGSTWNNIFTQIPTIGIGDLAIDPANENILYAGTGESNASSNTFLGSGIYKSTDAGQNWISVGLENSAYIGRIIVDYNNSSRIFAAACGNLFTKNSDRGIYRSINGGTSWEKVLFVTDSTSGVDIVQNPTNPDILYASMWERYRGLTYRRSFGSSSGIYKTIDGGTTWTKLTTGLPSGDGVGRIGLAISESNPNVLYTIIDKNDYVTQVFKTTNAGNSWTQTNDGALSDINNTFGWYFGQIRVDPANENLVYALGQYYYISDDGGESWTESSDIMHVDHHAFEFAGNKIWEGNDGGLYYSTDQGVSWNKTNNLPITQFYDIALDSTNTSRIYGGTQDNNSIRTTTGNIDDWEVILGGDGMYCLVDYSNPNIYYAEYQNGGLNRFENGNQYYIGFDGERTNWATPYIMHPTNPSILYLGTYQIQKTTNKGDSWTPISQDLTKGGNNTFHTLTTLDISKINPQILITGSSDGKVFVTSNDGGTWTDISSGLPDRWITRVKTDPFDVNTIYASVSGFRWDEHFSHIFKSTNLGSTWQAIDGNLPEIPINAMVLDPDVSGRIFVGTDAGVYMTNNNGMEWECISVSLPNAPVMAMEFHHADRKLFIGTYGVSAYKANIPLNFSNIHDLQTNNKIGIFPNPARINEAINLTFNSDFISDVIVKIYDISGKEISKSVFKSRKGSNNFNICNNIKLKKGTYLCKLSINEKNQSIKFIVNN